MMDSSKLKLACRGYSGESILIVFGAISWLTAMIAQVLAIKSNKKISEDKKKFLIPQETADGLSNTLLYLGFTTGLSKIAKNLVNKFKITNVTLEKAIKYTAKKNNLSIKDFKETIGNSKEAKYNTLLMEILRKDPDINISRVVDEFKPSTPRLSSKVASAVKIVADKYHKTCDEVISKVKFENYRKVLLSDLAGKYDFPQFRSNIGLLATLVGSILSINIATPLIRNEIGYYFKTKSDAEMLKKNPYPKIMETSSFSVPQKAYTPFTNITNI